MAVNRAQTIVGVFDEPAMASRTVDLLQGAGFSDAQISYLDPTQNDAGAGGGFLAGLKRLFAGPGPETDTGDVADDLTNMGLTQDEAQYYSDQYSAGHAIIAVRPDSPEQGQDALEILRSNGARNYATSSGAARTGSYAQSTDYGQTGTYTQPTDYDQTSTSTRPADYTQGSSSQPADYTQTNTTTQPADYTQGGSSQPADYTQGSSSQAADYTQTNTTTQPADYTQGGSSQPADYTQTNTSTRPADYTQGSSSQAADYTQTNTSTRPADYTQTNDYADTEENRSLRLREEQLRAEKERVQSGEVGLHKDVVTEQQTINVPVTHEEVVVERRPVSAGQVDDATPIGQNETIRVPVSEEQVNVTKTPVVTGEVSIGKRAVEENQQVTDTIRREEARVEGAGDVPIEGNNRDLIDRDTDRNA